MARYEQYQERSFEPIVQRLEQLTSLAELTADETVDFGVKVGKTLARRKLKTSQIRKFFDSMKSIAQEFASEEEFNRDRVILLRPRLAYAAGRQQNQVIPLMQVLDPAIQKVHTYADFRRLIDLVEGILAYHRLEGGQE